MSFGESRPMKFTFHTFSLSFDCPDVSDSPGYAATRLCVPGAFRGSDATHCLEGSADRWQGLRGILVVLYFKCWVLKVFGWLWMYLEGIWMICLLQVAGFLDSWTLGHIMKSIEILEYAWCSWGFVAGRFCGILHALEPLKTASKWVWPVQVKFKVPAHLELIKKAPRCDGSVTSAHVPTCTAHGSFQKLSTSKHCHIYGDS